MNSDAKMTIEASGFDAIEKEARLIFNDSVERKITEAVFADAKDALWRHIKEDVYSRTVYYPKEYERRSEHGGGKSLIQSAEEAEKIGPRDYGTNEWVAGLQYEPTPEHENFEWSDDVSPNELIGRIEKKEPKYNYNPATGEIPNRPFWQNFVWEMIEGGGFAGTLERELKARGIAEPDDHISGVIRQDEDGNY